MAKKPTPQDVEAMPTDEELDSLQAIIDKALEREEAAKASENEAGGQAACPVDFEEDAGAAAVARIEELEAEVAGLKDQALRALAESENVKRRTEREVEAAKAYGNERFAQDILSVVDNLGRALQTVDGKTKEDLGDNAKNLLEGIELTEKELMAVLARNGIKAVPGKGAKFDPNVHQAVANIPSDEEKGHVAEVMQTGFTIGDRTLRAAIVAVSTGPVKS